VANEGGKAYIPFKKNATGRARGSTLWSKMYHYFQLNRDDFADHYHKRSGSVEPLVGAAVVVTAIHFPKTCYSVVRVK
jgi:hypothetical protein